MKWDDILNKKLKIVIILTAILTISIYYRITIFSRLEYIKQLNIEIDRKNQFLNNTKIEAESLVQSQLFVNKLIQQNEQINKIIPYKIDLQNIVLNISQNLNSIELKSISCELPTPIAIDDSQLVYQNPFEIYIVGSYTDIENFIEQLKSIQNLYKLKNIHMDLKEDKYFNARLNLYIYSLEKSDSFD